MARQKNDNDRILAPKASEDRAGLFENGVWRPYRSVAEANASIPRDYRHKTLEVWVAASDAATPVKHVYLNGIEDANLVVVATGPGVWEAFVTSLAVGGIAVSTQLQGLTDREVLKKLLSRPFAALAVSIGSFSTQEQGSTASIAVQGTVTANDEPNITSRKVKKNGVDWQTFTGNSFSFPDTVTVPNTYTVEVIGVQSGTKTATQTVNFDVYHWYGPASARPTSASVRSLAGKIFKTGQNTFTLNTGNTATRFYIALGPGESLVSVTDQDALNKVITNEYILVNSNFSANDAAGNPVAGGKLYEKIQTVPYTENHRHNVTIA